MLDITYDPPNRQNTKSITWMAIDSLIIAAIAFLAALPADRLPNLFDLYVALKAFAYAFVVQLAVERGLKPKINKNSNNNKSRGEK
jgi:hypothetical protein